MGWGGFGRLFEAGCLLTFSAFRMGVNSSLGAYSNKYGMHTMIKFECRSYKEVQFHCNWCVKLKIWLNLGTSTVETNKYCNSELNGVCCL